MLIPAKQMIKIMEASEEERWTLAQDVNRVVLYGDEEHYEFDLLDPDEFPDVDIPDTSAFHYVAASDFVQAIKRTVFAVGQNSKRLSMTGVCLQSDDDKVNVVATCGRRIAWQEMDGLAENDHKIETAVIPVPVLKLIARALKDKSLSSWHQVQITCTKDMAVFRWDKHTVWTRFVDNWYPRWQKHIPNPDQMHCAKIAEVKPLLSVLKSVEASLDRREPLVDLTFDNGRLVISVNGKGNGSLTTVTTASFDGTAKMTLNPKFLIQFLRVLDADTALRWYIPDGTEPTPTMLQTITDNSFDGYSYVVQTTALDSPIISEAERQRIEGDADEEPEPVSNGQKNVDACSIDGDPVTVLRESGEKKKGVVVPGKKRGTWVAFADPQSGKTYDIPSRCCTWTKRGFIAYIVLTDEELAIDTSLLDIFAASFAI
jgi:DNA polymerase III sliding clamp (beta) subunit (PCNA family)